MSKEIKKNVPAPKPEPKAPKEIRERHDIGKANNRIEKGEARKPTMETPIPPPPKKDK